VLVWATAAAGVRRPKGFCSSASVIWCAISPPLSGAPSRRRRRQLGSLGSHALLLVCWFGSDGILKSGSSGFTRTRARIFGYPKCRVFIISDKFRVTVFKTRNFKNPKNPTRNFRVTRMPTHTVEGPATGFFSNIPGELNGDITPAQIGSKQSSHF
jgi:hypothetical protein